MRLRAIRTAGGLLPVLSLSLLLIGCATSGIARPDPTRLLPCAGEPEPPVGRGDLVTDPATGQQRRLVTDEEVASYLLAWRAAHGDCRSRFDWLRNWFAALPD